jgi:hypothetical protein
MVDQRLDGCTFQLFANTERRSDRLRNESAVTEGSELDEPHTVAKSAKAPSRDFQGEASLACPTRPDKGE